MRAALAVIRIREQAFCIFVLRLFKYFLGLTDFHDSATLHHSRSVRKIACKAEVVRYKYYGVAALFLYLLEQRKYLLLYVDIERRSRLIGKQYFRFTRKRYRYRYSLTHATRKMMRHLAVALFYLRNANLTHQLCRFHSCLRAS